VAGGSRRLHNEELRNFYTSPETSGACSTYEKDEKCIQNFGRETWKGEAFSKTCAHI